MNRHVIRLLLMLYPRPWRDRYGTEVVRLTQELIATGETTPTGGALNLAAAALAERFRALAASSRTAVAMAVAALLAVAGSFYANSHSRPQKPPSAASTVIGPLTPAKLTSCVKAALLVGGKQAPLKRILVPARVTGPVKVEVTGPVKVTVPGGSDPAKVAAVLKTPHLLCVVTVSQPTRRDRPPAPRPG
jgi:hypothetical protein